MFDFCYLPTFKIVLTAFITIGAIYSLYCLPFIPTKKIPKLQSRSLLWLSTGIFVVIRLLYSSNTAQDMDMNTWIASAITVAQADELVWTLLNYADGRPLTVLPLVIIEGLGIELSFRLTEMIGVAVWACSFLIFGSLVGPITRIVSSLVLLWFSSLWFSGLTAYNSEIVGCFFLVVALWVLQKRVFGTSYVQAEIFSIGFWLGCFPLVKFQIIPMGIVFGLYLCWKFYDTKSYKSIFYLIFGALMPVVLVVCYFAYKNQLEVLLNDYLYNYFVYAYTDEFSHRAASDSFSLSYIFAFLTNANQTKIFWVSMVVAVIIGVVCGFRQLKNHSLMLALLWWLSTFYAVLQAGNQFGHYLLLLLFPTLWCIHIFYENLNLGIHKIMIGCLCLGIIGQTGANTWVRYQLPTRADAELVTAISRQIKTIVVPANKVVIWGYSDAVYVQSRCLMGYRSPYTFWVYYPSSQQEFRIQEFLSDMKLNKPRFFIDAFNPLLVDSYLPAGHWELFPAIKTYITTHYAYKTNVKGVRFFERKSTFDK